MHYAVIPSRSANQIICVVSCCNFSALLHPRFQSYLGIVRISPLEPGYNSDPVGQIHSSQNRTYVSLKRNEIKDLIVGFELLDGKTSMNLVSRFDLSSATPSSTPMLF